MKMTNNSIIKKTDRFIRNHMENSFTAVLLLSILGILFSILFLIVYPITETISINLIGTIISLLLLLSYLRKSKTLVYFWLIFLTYNFPFQFIYGYLDNLGNPVYSAALGIMLLYVPIIVSDLIMSLAIVIIGAIPAYFIASPALTNLYSDLSSGVVYIYLLSFVLAISLLQRKNHEMFKRVKGALAMSYSIVHEIKTPITAMKLYTDDLKILKFTETNTKKLQAAVLGIDYQLNNLNIVGDFLLMNARSTTLKNQKNFKIQSIYNCIEYTLNNYPYRDNQGISRKLIIWNKTQDFMFLGEKHIMSNVIFNLIRNSIRSIVEKGSGEIKISNKKIKNKNYLIFQDTGVGVKKAGIKKLFDGFQTTNETGTGLGLFFCKNAIEAFNGNISVTSKSNEHFTVTIKLPNLT